MKLIDKDALVEEIERRIEEYKNMKIDSSYYEGMVASLEFFRDGFINTIEAKEVDVSKISENLAEAHEYLDFTTTWNFAHNKPMVSARLKWAIRGLFDAGLFELTHDKQYRMECFGLKAREGE